ATAATDSGSDRIRHLPISPAAPLIGARGVVYLLPDLADCQPVKRSKEYLAETYIRVALIADDGDCPAAAKVAQAQYDGAVAAMVYNDTLTAAEMSSILGAQLAASQLAIPIVAVDRGYGETLRLEVSTLLDEAWHGDGTQYRAIFASIYDDDENAHLGAWEITLISLVVVLALGFCASLMFHLLASRRRRRLRHQRNGGGGGGGTPGGMAKGIETLPMCALDRLELRTVTRSDMEVLSQCTTPLDNILNPSRVRSLNGSCDCQNSAGKRPESPVGDQTAEPCQHGASCAQSTVPDSALRGCIATCIVCIDDFVAGSKMRILPCGHNYHIECIDPWLTAKSSLCPLCKYDTRNVLTDLERAYSGPRILADLGALENNSIRTSFDASQPSSYLAESRSHLSLAGAMRHIAAFTRHIAVPVQALTRKVNRACRRGPAISGSEGIVMSPRPEATTPADDARYVTDVSRAGGLGSVPVTYSVRVDDDEKSAMVSQPQHASDTPPSSTSNAGKMGVVEKQHCRSFDDDDDDDDILDIDAYMSRYDQTFAAAKESSDSPPPTTT
ncbi:hypothetical protein H4R19_003907, partial [Coemansia spiralis]